MVLSSVKRLFQLDVNKRSERKTSGGVKQPCNSMGQGGAG